MPWWQDGLQLLGRRFVELLIVSCVAWVAGFVVDGVLFQPDIAMGDI